MSAPRLLNLACLIDTRYGIHICVHAANRRGLEMNKVPVLRGAVKCFGQESFLYVGPTEPLVSESEYFACCFVSITETCFAIWGTTVLLLSESHFTDGVSLLVSVLRCFECCSLIGINGPCWASS